MRYLASLALYKAVCCRQPTSAVTAMPGCLALLLLLWCSLAASHHDFLTTSSTSSSGSGGRIRILERSRLSRKNLEGPTVRSLLPTYCGFHYFSRCVPLKYVLPSRGRSLPQEISPESLYARSGLTILEQAVLQALGEDTWRETNFSRIRKYPTTL